MKQKLTFDELTIRKAIEIDLLFHECAKLAVYQTVSWNFGTTGKRWLDKDKEWMMQCYSHAPFSVNELEYPEEVCVKYQERIWKSFTQSMGDMNCHVNEQWLDLMTPVFFYILIVSNEFNYEAVRKRVRRSICENKPHSRKNMMDVDEWGNVKLDEITRKLAYDRYKDHSYVNKFEKTLKQAVTKHGVEIGDERDAIQCSLLAKSFDKDEINHILYRKESASIGLFLRDILSLDGNKQKNVLLVNTLLRMYIIDYYDNILSRTSKFRFNEIKLFDVEMQNMLLTKAVHLLQPKAQVIEERKAWHDVLDAYAELLKRLKEEIDKCPPTKKWVVPETYQISIIDSQSKYLENTLEAQLLSLPEESDKPTGSFLEAYSHLINTFDIDESVINSLSELYLNKDVLKDNMKLDKTSKNYFMNVRNYLQDPSKNHIQLEETQLHQINAVCWEYLTDEMEDYLCNLQAILHLRYKDKKIKLKRPTKRVRYSFKKESENFSWQSKACFFCLLDRVCLDCNLRNEQSNIRFACPYDAVLLKRSNKRKENNKKS